MFKHYNKLIPSIFTLNPTKENDRYIEGGFPTMVPLTEPQQSYQKEILPDNACLLQVDHCEWTKKLELLMWIGYEHVTLQQGTLHLNMDQTYFLQMSNRISFKYTVNMQSKKLN